MSDKLKELYQEVILKHNSHPSNYVKRESAQHQLEAYNPVCGDQFHLYFDMDGDQLVDLSFHGYGCAISKASSSILTELANNGNRSDIIALHDSFISVLSDQAGKQNLPQDLKAFTPVIQHPGRIQCVTLSWERLVKFLKESA